MIPYKEEIDYFFEYDREMDEMEEFVYDYDEMENLIPAGHVVELIPEDWCTP